MSNFVLTFFIVTPIIFIFILRYIYPVSQKELKKRIYALQQINKQEERILGIQKEIILTYGKITKELTALVIKSEAKNEI